MAEVFENNIEGIKESSYLSHNRRARMRSMMNEEGDRFMPDMIKRQIEIDLIEQTNNK